MRQKDLASEAHWSQRYAGATHAGANWKPADYNSRVLEHAILRALRGRVPESILEVGCGNSTWLPFLASRFGTPAAGIDYSPIGCEQAEQQLAANGVSGEIFCADVFDTESQKIGQYDFVYSLGLVEHFSDLKDIVQALAKFVKPGGVLFTEIPNLASFHGLLSKIYQPQVLAKHQTIPLVQLRKAYEELGFEDIQGNYVGVFSLNIVAWGVEPRFPKMDRYILPTVRFALRASDRILNLIGPQRRGLRLLAPFIFVAGKKPQVAY